MAKQTRSSTASWPLKRVALPDSLITDYYIHARMRENDFYVFVPNDIDNVISTSNLPFPQLLVSRSCLQQIFSL